jgi:hypothetical protein
MDAVSIEFLSEELYGLSYYACDIGNIFFHKKT